MDKREMVIESIQKLLSLGVSDKEIEENLFDVGIDKTEAQQLIAEAKSPPVKEEAKEVVKEVESKPKEVLFEEKNSNLSMNEQIINQIPLAKKDSTTASDVQVVSESGDIAEKIMKDVEEQDVSDEESIVGEDVITGDEVDEQEDIGDEGISKSNEIEQNLSNPVNEVKKIQNAPAVPKKDILPEKNKQVEEVKQTQVKENAVPQKTVSQQKEISSTQKSYQSIPNIAFDSSDKVIPVKKTYPDTSSPDFEELWKKGIVVAVNAKLGEMKSLKENISSELQEKVDEAVRKELYQYKVLLDSQKELMISSNKEALEQKQKEIVFIIDAKIAELKQYNKQLSDNLANIEASRRQQELALSQINQALDEAKKTKAQMIVEMNSEMIKTKSQAQAFIDNATTHLNQMDERINKTLELEKNIAEGMLAQAEQKIESLTIQKADELIANMEVELNRLQAISKKISPEMLDQKIAVLEEFKKQFLTSMQQNLSQINTAIDELNQKNILADRLLEEKTLAIDAKLEELTKFEKSFAQRLDEAINKKS